MQVFGLCDDRIRSPQQVCSLMCSKICVLQKERKKWRVLGLEDRAILFFFFRLLVLFIVQQHN